MKPEDYQKLVDINNWQNFDSRPVSNEEFLGTGNFDYIHSDKLYSGDDEIGKPNIYGETRTTRTRFWEILGTDGLKYFCTALTIPDAKQKLVKMGQSVTIKAIREITQLEYEVAREEKDGFSPRAFLDEIGVEVNF